MQGLLHVEENESRDLVFINVKNVEYLQPIQRVQVDKCVYVVECVMILMAFCWRRKRGCK